MFENILLQLLLWLRILLNALTRKNFLTTFVFLLLIWFQFVPFDCSCITYDGNEWNFIEISSFIVIDILEVCFPSEIGLHKLWNWLHSIVSCIMQTEIFHCIVLFLEGHSDCLYIAFQIGNYIFSHFCI